MHRRTTATYDRQGFLRRQHNGRPQNCHSGSQRQRSRTVDRENDQGGQTNGFADWIGWLAGLACNQLYRFPVVGEKKTIQMQGMAT